jgi:hypothetical protein
VAGANVAAGRWAVRRRPWPFRPRYVVRDAAQAERDRRLDLDEPDPDWTPATAALVCLAVAAAVLRLPPPPTEAVLRASGPREGLCRVSAEHLPAAHWRNRGTALATD